MKHDNALELAIKYFPIEEVVEYMEANDWVWANRSNILEVYLPTAADIEDEIRRMCSALGSEGAYLVSCGGLEVELLPNYEIKISFNDGMFSNLNSIDLES